MTHPTDDPMREETGMEHIARDIREGRFPERSPRQQVPVEAAPQPAPEEGLGGAQDGAMLGVIAARRAQA